MSQKRNGVSNHRDLYGLSKSLLRLATKKNLHFISPAEENLPPQKGGKVESVYMSWRHQVVSSELVPVWSR